MRVWNILMNFNIKLTETPNSMGILHLNETSIAPTRRLAISLMMKLISFCRILDSFFNLLQRKLFFAHIFVVVLIVSSLIRNKPKISIFLICLFVKHFCRHGKICLNIQISSLFVAILIVNHHCANNLLIVIFMLSHCYFLLLLFCSIRLFFEGYFFC